MKLARDAARDDAAERAQGAIRSQRDAGAIAHLFDPRCRRVAAGINPRGARPLSGTLPGAPAKVKIGGAKIKPQTNEHAAAHGIEHRIARIFQRRPGDIEHEQLLRQHFRQLARCNPEAIHRHRQVVEVVARERRVARGIT